MSRCAAEGHWGYFLVGKKKDQAWKEGHNYQVEEKVA